MTRDLVTSVIRKTNEKDPIKLGSFLYLRNHFTFCAEFHNESAARPVHCESTSERNLFVERVVEAVAAAGVRAAAVAVAAAVR